MKTRNMRVLIFGDTHAPFHNPNVVKLTMKVVFIWKPDLIIHTGDMFDCGAVSRFPRDPEHTQRLIQEMNIGHQILGLIPSSIKRVFCLGNHEDRIRKYMWKQAPELWGFLAEDKLLGLESIGWHTVPYLESFKIGDLVVAHDFGRAGKTAVKHAMSLHPGKTVVIGHTHRLEQINVCEHGRSMQGFSSGWGGQVEAIKYLHRDRVRHEWQHGLIGGSIDDNGIPHLTSVPVLDECKCYFDGQTYEV